MSELQRIEALEKQVLVLEEWLWHALSLSVDGGVETADHFDREFDKTKRPPEDDR